MDVLDLDLPEHATPRPAWTVQQGYHVRVDGRFLLVDTATGVPGGKRAIVFTDGSMLTVLSGAQMWTRSPAEQIEHMGSLLPARDHYRPSAPIGTLYSGSAPSPISAGVGR